MGIFISIPEEEINNAQEAACLNIAEEVKIEIIDVTTGTDTNGYDYMIPVLKFIDYPEAKTFNKFLSIPSESMPADKRSKSLIGLKKFYRGIGVDFSQGVDSDSLVGMQFWAIVGVDSKHKQVEEYGPQNYIKRFIGTVR
jgi:hypothetical protein